MLDEKAGKQSRKLSCTSLHENINSYFLQCQVIATYDIENDSLCLYNKNSIEVNREQKGEDKKKKAEKNILRYYDPSIQI